MSPLEFHVLLILAGGQLYGYAIKKGVEEQSKGVISPEIGSLYRVLRRLMEAGWVAESDTRSPEDGPQRGRPRRYYRITPDGTEVARAEIRRLRRLLAEAPDLAPEGAQ